MIRFVILVATLLSLAAADQPDVREPSSYKNLVDEARAAEGKGLLGKALKSLDQAIAMDPKRFDAYFFKGRILALQRQSEAAIAAFTKVIEIDPKASTAYNLRGWERFKRGEIEKSIEDFNRYIALEPRQEPYHWQRGIALYYAGKFDEGRKQFEQHQTVNPNDVENGVWHFACVARSSGFEQARQSMLPISGDSRVPMQEIYNLFAGKGTADDVLKATKQGGPSTRQLEDREFYAELYLGLYFEAKGDTAAAYEHIKKAATDFVADHYMGDVARVHFKRLVTPRSAK
jgi:lipoprotein NlpI